ncbi:MAG: 50S ribosomal protein L1 [candidate division WWE3 bacterium GW2011_GWB1_44_4]|uniref:Large ribosomal subunit protein uL1 n=1 Tax=candidate division WWE3 bacterium GW2011_GWB1_44_4 TaxID=1619116 RepID=A0A0G1JBV2_UNCKA|nr:MAG: 50S ribosomal protein L1 [candidate division WWE3 bacterium GW2011_GWB1_44_4]
MTINEAITKVKESSREKFDASIEVHVNCVLDKEKQETVRLGVLLPHGTGKSKKIAVIAKILGPAGLMPNPKNGTVTEDVKKAVAQFKKGRTDVRNEANGSVIHTVIGKRSFTDQALTENFQELISALRSGKAQKVGQDWIKSVYICSSMGPSFEVAL